MSQNKEELSPLLITMAAVAVGGSLAVAVWDTVRPEPEPRTEWPRVIQRLELYVDTAVYNTQEVIRRYRRRAAMR